MKTEEDKKMLKLIDKLEKEIEISDEDFEKLSIWYSKSVNKLKNEIAITKIKNQIQK